MKTLTPDKPSLTPTIVKRPAQERGQTELGWLHSRHTFSFGDYFDRSHMNFRALRVINDDVVEPGQGFGEHPHRDAEIFTYVIDGQLEHHDSMDNGSIIKAGDLQYMSAGRGVFHSEYNPSPDKPVHLLQIWLKPRMGGGEPRYAEKALGSAALPNSLTLLFAGEPKPGAVETRADADIYFGKLDAKRSVTVHSGPERGTWIHVISGSLDVLGESLEPGDGAAVSGSDTISIDARADSEFLVFVMK